MVLNSDGKISRITFSRSLAEYIVASMPGHSWQYCNLNVGKRLQPNEKSKTGLYAICKAKSGWILRVTLFQELAEWWRDESRIICEVYVEVTERQTLET